MSHPSPLVPHPSARRGSALLIVLGMLSFMVISAVAFSAYMRYARLPSSYLRRASSSRLLVKAALAEAIDEIDSAIGNNPHPGIGNDAYTYNETINSRDKGNARPRNAWKNRIYLGTNTVSGLVPADQTVSTLTLEGLAYIPPALVNDARYYSRRSRAGLWKNLAFDSGRYAFCAIDVSDFLNVNALMADVARSGSSDRRISLAYLFENDDHTSASGSNGSPSEWDKFIDNYVGSGKVPLVSLADLNLALWDKQPNGWTSVFCDYVENKKTSFYGGIGPTSEEADRIRRQAFITDSYFPDGEEQEEHGSGQADGGHIDLDEEENQPFTKGELRANKTVMQVASCVSQGFSNKKTLERLQQCLDPIGLCALYDYLDNNDDPLSLAIPTTERVPMICGIGFSSASAGTLTVKADPQNGNDNKISPDASTAQPGTPYKINLDVKYSIEGLPQAPAQVTVVYPFRHDWPKNGSYEIGGRLAYFLTKDDAPMGFRTSANDILHVRNADLGTTSYKTVDDAILTVGFTPQDLSEATFAGRKNGPKDAAKTLTLQPAGIIPTSVPFLEVSYEGTDTFDDDGNGKAMVKPDHSKIELAKGDKVLKATCSWKPLLANGAIAPDFNANLAANLGNAAFTKNIRVNLAVWLWVKNKETGRIVDMAPACVYDDGELNSRNVDSVSKMFGEQFLGGAYPVMRFDLAAGGTAPLAFASADAGNMGVLKPIGSAQVAVTPQTVLVCDPRFNHAPESWFQTSGTADTWFDKCECGYKTAGAKASDGVARDGDIFLSVSDNEELQSVFELANLPRLTEFYREGSTWSFTYVRPNTAWTQKTFPAAATDTANFKFMWKSYDPFGRYQNGGDDFEGLEMHASCKGYKLTPYSTQTNVMMAAFANTPHEWRLSSANDQTMQAASVPDDAKGFNAKYAWNGYSSGARIDWYDLEELCGSFMEEMRVSNGTKNWEDVWADLDWVDFGKTGEESAKYLLNDLQLTDKSGQGRIYSCDRKFLYGFWHDCFELKQQLFLVFVRAEPSMLGGGSVKQTPPQLGARAVALVWRDPTESKDGKASTDPHQTRVLFYRQFD